MKTILFLFLTILAQLSMAQHHHHDAPSTHGMLLFGQEKIYLSHLPMFHNPHDYQVLLEVEISKEAKKTYLASLESNPQQPVFTIVPETFVLPEVVKMKKSFMAQVFLGHFERGGKPITHMVKFDIKKVLYFKKFNKADVQPEKAKYILIGNKNEQFLIHTITAKPDFDYVSKVEVKKPGIESLLLLLKSISLEFDLPNENPLIKNTLLTSKAVENEKLTLDLIIKKEIYLEFGDLSF